MYLILNASEGVKGYIAIRKLSMILSTESSERDQEGDTLGRQREKQVNKGSACLRWSASSSTSLLETKAWQLPPIRPITDGLAQQVQGWIRTCHTTVVDQPTTLSTFKFPTLK